MEPNEMRELIIWLLSSNRRNDRPQICQSLTRLQISGLIEEMLPPNQDQQAKDRVTERLGEQLDILLQEFEIITTGDSRLRYCMAPPSLIVIREVPFLARYVGDRAYIELVREKLEAGNIGDGNRMGSRMSLGEARDTLEQIGISVQTEEMLFQAVPDPSFPTEMELSMAEQIPLEDISEYVDVYVPIRDDFMATRWMHIEQCAPSTRSLLYRARADITSKNRNRRVYLWKRQNEYLRLSVEQAFLAMYKIDIQQNAPRLLDLDQDIPYAVIGQMPRDYARLVLRYSVKSVGYDQVKYGGHNSHFNNEQRRIRPKYKSFVKALLEDKLGINRSMS